MRVFLVLLLAVSSLVGAAEPELLEPEKAFQFAARLRDPGSIEVNYRIAQGYYLYRDKFRFSAAPSAVKLGSPQIPPGKRTRDEFFGEVETHRGDLTIIVPFQLDGADVPALTLTAISQGCADAGVCYTPQEQTAELMFVSVAAAPAQPGAATQLFGAQPPVSDAQVTSLFATGFWVVIASFFGFGLLLSLTPCVLPMVPILSGVIVGGGARVTKRRGLALAALYVLGMAVTYALAGIAAGLSGAMLAAVLQNPWVVGAFAAVFVALALAMFGLYELQLPVALQSRLAEASGRLRGGHATGVFAIGVLSALIVGPCVAAPLAGALLYISQSRDVVLGGSALFAMALGMGVPLLAVGASAGALLPKVGPWMETVKRFFGVLMLGVAIYLVSPFVTETVHFLAWGVLLVVTGVFLRAIDPLPTHARGFEKFSKGIGVIALVAGVAFLVGAFSGARDILRPLSGLRLGAAETSSPNFRRVASLVELERHIQSANGRPVMLDFYADWCVTCKEMERYTFSDPGVQERMGQMLLLQADVTASAPEHLALLKRFRLFGPPGIIFFDRSGREIEGLRVIGFQPAREFAAVLDRALTFR